MSFQQAITRIATAIAIAGFPVSASSAEYEKGPNGGHLVDVADRYHLELVADGLELRLYVSDVKDRKVAVAGASAKATVISAGGKSSVELKPAGENILRGTGTFARSKGMKVDLMLNLPGVPSPVAAKFLPLAAEGEHKHGEKGHKH